MKKSYLPFLLMTCPLFASDPIDLSAPLKPHAPLEVHKGERADPAITASEGREIAGEFRGILSMGVKDYSYNRWPGKEMSDCRTSKSAEWCGQCELITGHARSYFNFYKEAGASECTLQQLDVHFQVSDPAVIKPLRGVTHQLLGGSIQAEKPASRESGWEGSGKGWKWEGDTDLAYLYMDREQSSGETEGVARFQWRRSPLFKPAR
jgi:hypothetical protein